MSLSRSRTVVFVAGGAVGRMGPEGVSIARGKQHLSLPILLCPSLITHLSFSSDSSVLHILDIAAFFPRPHLPSIGLGSSRRGAMRRRRPWAAFEEIDFRELSDDQQARVWAAQLCVRFKQRKCNKGAKCKFLHATERDLPSGRIGHVYTTEVLKEGENHEIVLRARGSNLWTVMQNYIAAHDPDVPGILSHFEHQGARIRFDLNAPLHAQEMIMSCEWDYKLGQGDKKNGKKWFKIMHGMLHCTSVHAAMSALLTGHLLARKPEGTEGDETPVGSYFAPEEQYNCGYNLGAMFRASLFGIFDSHKSHKFGRVVPTGFISTLPRAAKDHITDAWSHQLSSVTFDTVLLEGFLQRWMDDGHPTVKKRSLGERRENEEEMSHRQLTYFGKTHQDAEKLERTLTRLDERHKLLSSRFSQKM